MRVVTGIDSQYFKLTKISDKNCPVIIEIGSCVNIVASNMVIKFGLKVVFHPQPYKVSCVNSVFIDVKERCLVPIQFATDSDKICFNVVAIDVGHVILGRPWLYDLDVTIYGSRTSFRLSMMERRSN